MRNLIPVMLILGACATALAGPDGDVRRGGSRWGESYFPNVPLVTHEGKTVRFFDDLVKDKVVVINFIYTRCPDVCPLETAQLAEVRAILGTMTHPAMKGLADNYLQDEELMSAFRRCPAAVSVHHAYIGGLLEHTRQMLKLADGMLPQYPQLSRDLVLMGVFLHDLGKTVELEWM